jgi:hypothetical protein
MSKLKAKGYSNKGTSGGAYWTYSCVRDAYHMKSCAKVHIKGAPTDDHIEGIVLAALADQQVKAALTRTLAGSVDSGQVDDVGEGKNEADLRGEFIALQERIVQVEAAFMEGPAELERLFSISPDGYRAWRSRALEKRDELDRQISRNARSKIIVAALAEPVAYWIQAALSERRDLVRLVLPEIVVVPASSIASFPQRWDKRRIRATPLGA